MARSRSHTRRPARSLPRGVLLMHAGGYGFVRTAEGEWFIPAAKLGGAFDGDTVEVAPLPAASSKARRAERREGAGAGRPAARVARVVERAHETVVGRYEVADPFGVVIPEDPRIPYDIFTQRAEAPQVPDGALVRVRITGYPSRRTAATGVVEEVLGEADEPRLAVESVIARHKLAARFSDAALAQADQARLDVLGAVVRGYRDLWGRLTFTVDPVDARDFDDALSLERVEGGRVTDAAPGEGAEAEAGASGSDAPAGPVLCGSGWEGAGRPAWRLGVHIADVSAYVPWGSALDLDARERGTSAYLVDRVIPMLPARLSDDLCSLVPGRDRLAMTADLFLDEAGRIARFELYPAVIRSDARLDYGRVQQALEANGAEGAAAEEGFASAAAEAAGAAEGAADGVAGIASAVLERLGALDVLAQRRAELRRAAGGIDFPSAEAKVRLDAQGRAVGVDVRRKTRATALVEEAMLLANEAVARCLRDAGCPALFRVHERPAADSLSALTPLLAEFDWFARIDPARFVLAEPSALQAALAASRGRVEEELVGNLLLRAMKRADYRPACEGHYGLASAAYAHFTSPIRRYPDLVVHRMLKSLLFGRTELHDQQAAALPWLGRHCSRCEREAEAAARESQEIKLVELMEGQVGQAFSAVVSGVAPYGLYVRLGNTAEGLVPIRQLGREYFSFDAELRRLVGQDTGRIWRLGQRVAVVLARADARTATLDFRLA